MATRGKASTPYRDTMTPPRSAPEYELARKLIAHLKTQEDVAACVLAEPWDEGEQANDLVLAAKSHNLAVAVAPQPPVSLPGESDTTGGLQARLAVVVLTTRQVRGRAVEVQATAAARVLALCMGWAPEVRGIPYADATLEGVTALKVDDFPAFKQANLTGTVIALGKKVNYRKYFATPTKP